MNMTSSTNDLTERLRKRLETERRRIEDVTKSELRRLGENSRRVAIDALRTTERDTAVAVGRMRTLLLGAWLRPLVVGLSLWVGICGGSWATMHWLSKLIEARVQTVVALKREIEEAHQTLEQLETATWGIALREIDGERFVVLPTGALRYPPWTVGSRPAVRLSNE